MSEHFDAVVIGSGFGGAVMTYRLAEAGMRVCLLERGKPYPPNSFPRAPDRLGKNFWDPSEGLYGLFNVWSFKGSGALVSSGLGGGSLIYANVLKRKDERWFADELPDGNLRPWPVPYARLEKHYEQVERMMNAQQYPLAHKAYEKTYKTHALRECAGKLGGGDLECEWLPLNLAVSFRRKPVASPGEDPADNPPLIGAEIDEEFPNIHNMPRTTCRLCGECDLGCNFGSKNTLDFNYLSAAIRQKEPADIRTLCEVKSFAPDAGKGRGFRVEYVVHDPDKYEGIKINTSEIGEKKSVTCDYLILAAGTFGTQYLLAKNRTAFPRIGPALGARYSVNGDLLSFILNSIERKNGKSAPRRLDPAFGPVITSALRFADDLDGAGRGGRGFYIEDGGHPALLSWAAEIQGIGGYLKRTVKFLKIILKYRWGLDYDADLGAEIADLIGDASGAMSSMPVLAMGRDAPDARLYLENGRLACDWTIESSKAYYDRVRRAGKAIARALNAEYMDNPSYRWNFHQVLTAHPIGGCAMGRSKGEEAVVGACGEVFGHDGLYVADGSVLPGPVGPNPALTIAALSNRFAEHIIARHKGENHECIDE